MPNWKKLITSGSSAALGNLDVTNAVTASFFVGDGSALTGLDADTLDGIDSTDFYRQIAENTATVGPGWMTVALSSGARGHADIIVSDGDSGDHAFVQVNWLRSYADSSFTVLNTGGHQNRITGVRVIQDSGDVTYGKKYLQVYVTVSSAYYTRISKFGNPGAYTTAFTAPTPVIENTKTGYAVKGTALTSLSDYNFGAEQGVETNKLKVLDESILTGNVGIGTASTTNGKLSISTTSNQIALETGTSGDGRLNIGHFSNGTFIGTYGDDGGAADVIRLGTHSGDERMRITSAGNVGIGTTSAFTTGGTAKLSILGSSVAISIGASNSDLSYIRRTGTGKYQWQTYSGGNTGELHLQPYGGKVGIGTTSPGAALDVAGHISATGAVTASAFVGDGSALTGVSVAEATTVVDSFSSQTSVATTHNFGTKNVLVNVYDSNDAYIIPSSITTTNDNTVTTTFNVSTSGRIVVAKGGHIVGGTSANPQHNSIGVGTAASTTAGEIRATNDITAFYSSDKRLKSNITNIEAPLDKLNKINGVTFDWIETPGVHSHTGSDVGVIAQEIEEVLPDIVTTRDNGYKAVKYDKLVALLIESNKELNKKVEELQIKVDNLLKI